MANTETQTGPEGGLTGDAGVVLEFILSVGQLPRDVESVFPVYLLISTCIFFHYVLPRLPVSPLPEPLACRPQANPIPHGWNCLPAQ